jgi:drug/metabolite transporter (DMT)-like permease
MQPVVVNSLIALVFFTISGIIYKLTAKYSMPTPIANYFYYMVIYFFLSLLIPLFTPVHIIPANIGVLLTVAPYSILILIAFYFFFQALFELDLTVMQPLANLGTVFIAIFAVLFLHTALTPIKILLLAAVVITGLGASYDEKLKWKAFFSKQIFMYIMFVFCLTLSKIFLNKGLNQIEYWDYNFYHYVYLCGLIFLLTPFIYKKLKVPIKSILYLAVGIVFEYIALLFVFLAYKKDVIIPEIITILPLTSVAVVILSNRFKGLLEFHSNKVYIIRFTAIALMTAAIIAFIQ